MGGAFSFQRNTIVNVYPTYYTEVKPTEEDAVVAKHVWQLVLTDT